MKNDVIIALEVLQQLKTDFGGYKNIPDGMFREQFEGGLRYLKVCCGMESEDDADLDDYEYDDSDYDSDAELDDSEWDALVA